MPTEEPEFQQVLICLAQTHHQFSEMASLYCRKPGMETAKFNFYLRSFPTQKFLVNFSLSMDDPLGNSVEWELTCRSDALWNVELEIYFQKNNKYAECENIFSFPEKQITTATELIEAFDNAIADIKSSIESRDISSWLEMSKK
jgi:hypothetical protein